MSNRANVIIALIAGFIGGLTSHLFSSATVHAQPREIPRQIWAHEFVIADENGTAREVIGIEKDGKPSMEFLLPNGKVQTVRFNEGMGSIYVGGGPRHPTLLPIP